MIKSNLEGVEFVVGNTDAQALKGSLAQRRIQLGTTITRGLGAGSRPDVGRAAAEEHFMNLALMHEIDNEVDFIVSETNRLGKRYPKISVAPLYYRVEDNRLYCIR